MNPELGEVIGCRRCGHCCGPVMVNKAERILIDNYCRALQLQVHANKLTCRFFKPKQGCLIYPVRPLLCRAFGAIDHPLMTCPHGAKADVLVPEIRFKGTDWTLL